MTARDTSALSGHPEGSRVRDVSLFDPPELSSERLVFTPPTGDDASILQGIFVDDPLVTRFVVRSRDV